MESTSSKAGTWQFSIPDGLVASLWLVLMNGAALGGIYRSQDDTTIRGLMALHYRFSPVIWGD